MKMPATILICAAAARLVMLLAYWNDQPRRGTDDSTYLMLATTIYQGQGYSIDGRPTAYFPPGYPAVLALSFVPAGAPSVLAGQLLNIGLSMLLLVSLYAIALKIVSRRAALVALALVAFYPPQLAYPVTLQSEVYATSLLFAAMALLLYRRSAVLAGLLVGLSLLARPQYGTLFAAFVGWRFWRGER